MHPPDQPDQPDLSHLSHLSHLSLTRRAFLRMAAMLAALGAGAACTPQRASVTTPTHSSSPPPPSLVPATPTPDVEAGGEAELVAAVVREQLGYLNLDPAGVAAFARDFLDQFGEQERAHTLGRLASHEAQEMQHAAAQFLMSSDFFRHDADMARVVRYIAYYRPQLGCLNPLARFD